MRRNKVRSCSAWALTALAVALTHSTSLLAAGTCTPSIGNVAHGVVDPSTGLASNTVSTLSATCSGWTSGQQVLVCFSFGWTINGLGSCTGYVRYLKSAAGNSYTNAFYHDAAYSSVWADNNCSAAGPAWDPGITVTIGSGGTGSGTGTLYSQMLAGQTSVPPGTYSGDMSGDGARYFYRLKTGASDVCSNSVPAVTNGPAFQMSVTVSPACTITSTSDVNFGSASFLTANIDAQGSVAVRCTNTTPYTMALNGGQAASTDPTQRKMKFSTYNITYGLYSDAARTVPWGSATGATVAAVGTGSNQTANIYGRIPPQTSAPPGSYSDNIVVTVTY